MCECWADNWSYNLRRFYWDCKCYKNVKCSNFKCSKVKCSKCKDSNCNKYIKVVAAFPSRTASAARTTRSSGVRTARSSAARTHVPDSRTSRASAEPLVFSWLLGVLCFGFAAETAAFRRENWRGREPW